MYVASNTDVTNEGTNATETTATDVEVKEEEDASEEGGDPPADCELGRRNKFNDYDPGSGMGGSQAVLAS